jgi:hypothetical protein
MKIVPRKEEKKEVTKLVFSPNKLVLKRVSPLVLDLTDVRLYCYSESFG